MSTKRFFALISTAMLVLLGIGMFLTILQYFSFDKSVGFLAYKQPLINNSFWLSVFYIHVFTCAICLIAGLTQFSSDILEHSPKTHRMFGRIYVYNILLINFPMGLILAFYANGGLPGKMAFSLLAILWFYFTLSSVIAIRQGNIELHKIQMIRSYSLTLTAITLRLLKIVISRYSNWSYNDVYVFDAWAALSINLSVAQLILYMRNYRSKRKLIASR